MLSVGAIHFEDRFCTSRKGGTGEVSGLLSVGAIHFEDRFCTSRKGGTGEVSGCTALAESAWRLLQLVIERVWSALYDPSCFLA